MTTFIRNISFVVLALIFFCCCGDPKKVTYFSGVPDQEILYKAESLEPVIQKNDMLNITVASVNGEANQMFNLYNVVTNSAQVTAGTSYLTVGYLVDQDGYIQFPVLGKIQAAGLTKKQLRDTITKTLIAKNMLIDPVVSIRYLNYRVTVLGEVQRPSVINVPSEKITLLEALGLAGDITIYGNRDSILLIREEVEGKRLLKHINLTANSTELLTSPYYYLRSNDIVYVAPNKANVASANTTKLWLPAVFGGLSFVTALLALILN